MGDAVPSRNAAAPPTVTEPVITIDDIVDEWEGSRSASDPRRTGKDRSTVEVFPAPG